MEKRLGEDAVLEVNWTQLSEELGCIQYNSSYDIYEAEGIAKSQEELGAINHPHKIRDYDSEKYWGESLCSCIKEFCQMINKLHCNFSIEQENSF